MDCYKADTDRPETPNLKHTHKKNEQTKKETGVKDVAGDTSNCANKAI